MATRSSVEEVETGDDEVMAIEGESRRGSSSGGRHCVKEGVMLDHVAAHVIRPFEYLWADVIEESGGFPAAHNHNPIC